MMVHIEAIETIADLWLQAAADYIPPNKRGDFQKKLSLLSAQAINNANQGAHTYRNILAAGEDDSVLKYDNNE